jgi:hypothetical protein
MGARNQVGIKVFHRSNQMYELKHFGAPEKSVAGLRESLISSPFEKFAKGLEKYRK